MSHEGEFLYPLLACNARCPFCSSRVYTPSGIVATSDWLRGDVSRGIGAHTLSLAEAFSRYERMRAEGIDRVNLQGGEPTLYEGLFELIRHGKALGFKEQIVVTNGRRLADPAYAERLSRSGVSTIALSIFGATREVHDHSLGVAGAFDDMVAAVRNLAALAPGGAHVTGQLILHAHNHRELGRMIPFWYEQGIRSFGIRLLREVPNLEGEAGRSWFFDLALLGPELASALEAASALPGVSVVFPEIFYCLLGPRHLSFVLADLAAGRRIAMSEQRHGPRERAPRSLPLLENRDDACNACDLGAVCTRPEEPVRRLFSGALRSIDVAREVRALCAQAADGEAPPGLAKLLALEDDLSAFGVPPELLAPLRARYAPALRAPLAGLKDAIGKALTPDTVVRTISLGEIGARTRLAGPARAVLGRLLSTVPADRAASLRFLARADCLFSCPALYVFKGAMRHPSRGVEVPFVVGLYDEHQIDAATLASLLEEAAPRA